MMNFSELRTEDKLALAEAYRVYEILEGADKDKIPQEFVDSLLYYGDLRLVGPLDPEKSLKEQNISRLGMYIVMYMCTFA